jgi:phosphoribosylformylglycinamidine synthase
MGYENVEQVRIGKYIEVTLNADSRELASQQLDQMCDQLLANPVIENYRFEMREAIEGQSSEIQGLGVV